MIKIKWKYYWLINFSELWFSKYEDIKNNIKNNTNLFFYQSEKIDQSFIKKFSLKEKKFNTWIIDLSNNIDIIFKNFSQTIRNEINKIKRIINWENLYWLKEKKYNLEIELLENNKENLYKFIKFYNLFAKRKWLPFLKYSIIKKYINYLNIFQLSFNWNILIYHIYLIDKKEKIARLMYSCSLSKNKEERKIIWWLNNYFHLENMIFYKTNNFKFYDLWWLFLDNPWNDENLLQQEKITKYKLKFKPKIITQYHYTKTSWLYYILKNIYLKLF
jgi:hypothetical protein